MCDPMAVSEGCHVHPEGLLVNNDSRSSRPVESGPITSLASFYTGSLEACLLVLTVCVDHRRFRCDAVRLVRNMLQRSSPL